MVAFKDNGIKTKKLKAMCPHVNTRGYGIPYSERVHCEKHYKVDGFELMCSVSSAIISRLSFFLEPMMTNQTAWAGEVLFGAGAQQP